MIIQLTEEEIVLFKKYDTGMYNMHCIGNIFTIPNYFPVYLLDDIFPNKQLQFIKFKGVTLEEQINIQVNRIIYSEEFKKTVLDLYEKDHGSNVSNSKEFDKIIS